MSILPPNAVPPARPIPAPEDRGVVERLRDYARTADDGSRALVARRPLVAVAAGLAVGALLGWVVKR